MTTDIKRLRKVLDRLTPDELNRIGVFPLASRECSDDELRTYVDEAHVTQPAPAKERRAWEDGNGRWEAGFRNIVTVLGGVRESFEIPEVIEAVRAMTGAASEGPTPAWWKMPALATGDDRKRERYTGDPECEWQEFWKDIVAPGGTLDVEQVKKELADFSMLLHHVPLVYGHATGGNVSYPQTLPSAVISAIDNHIQDLVEDAIKDAAEDAATVPSRPLDMVSSGGEREAFENYARNERLMLDWSSESNMYWSTPTRLIWEGWQASAAHRREDQRDAERYRWLRDTYRLCWHAQCLPPSFGFARVIGPGTLDIEIDRAIAAMQRTVAPAQTDTEE